MKFELHTYVDVSWRRQYCGLYSMKKDGIVYYFLDNEYYFRRDQVYGDFDDGERFAFFSRAVVEMLTKLKWRPDIISCNDWQTALVPVYLRMQPHVNDDIRTVFTIHNIEYQGSFSRDTLEELFGLPSWLYNDGIIEYGGGINLMKAAIYYADALTTVSPTYADELRDPYYAHGLHQIIEDNSHKMRGILNGLDMQFYDPSCDDMIYAKYDGNNPDKARNKSALQEEFGLWKNPEMPLIGMVSRLVTHKGVDMIYHSLERIMSSNVQMIIMGMGDTFFAGNLKFFESKYQGKLSVNICFSDTIARKIYAASDMYLMPSKSEPCGLSQMIAMRYGSVPIVHATGGLRDTVRPYPAADSNGFSFSHYSHNGMMSAIYEALNVYFNDKNAWHDLSRRCMDEDFDWSNSAKQYIEIYRGLVN